MYEMNEIGFFIGLSIAIITAGVTACVCKFVFDWVDQKEW